MKFLSHAVLGGFTSAAAIIIGVSQLHKLLGYSIDRHHAVYVTLYRVLKDVGKTNGTTVAIAVESIAMLLLLRRAKRWMHSHPWLTARPKLALAVRSVPNALVVVVFNVLLVKFADLDSDHNVKVVGSIDGGLPTPTSVFGEVGDHFGDLLPGAVALALVGFVESISVAEACALKFGAGQTMALDASQELAALGTANALSSFFGAFPTTGGFSRSLVQANAGSRTPISGFVAALLLLLVLSVATSLFYHLPDATLSAIIVVAVSGLFNVKAAK